MDNNHIRLAGILEKTPKEAFCDGNQKYYRSVMTVKRLSGAEDQVPVLISGRLLQQWKAREGLALEACSMLQLCGRIRTSNALQDGKNSLIINAYATGLEPFDESVNPNLANLTGNLCKPPVYRVTPNGREICDMMLAVSRGQGVTDYVPLVVWGKTARWARHLVTGDRVQVVGRFQSRPYQKKLEDGTVLDRVAYEVSVMRMCKADCWED